MIVNPAKLAVTVVMIASASVMLALGRIDATAYLALVGPFTGLAIGNGINAKRGDAPAPLIAARPTLDRRATDRAEAVAVTAADDGAGVEVVPVELPADPFAD